MKAQTLDVSKSSNKSEQTKAIIDEQEPIFQIPNSFEQAIINTGERERIPLMWYFSSKKSMTIREFLIASSKRRIHFSPSWLPSEGSNFTKRLVKDDKMLSEDGKFGRELKYKLSDVGSLKVQKHIAQLDASSHTGKPNKQNVTD